ncbi:MAG TPA: carboxypeptidase-like regulatory domain-containing protein [Thermoanaerobaculia bacterium]|nr:carboxypeptidase-like regulatory domain-containing protein [Thermoanaerobaculia bacterium]
MSGQLIVVLLALSLEQWRLVHTTGAVETVWGTPRQVAVEELRSAWVWSAGSVPRRVPLSRIGREHLSDEAGRLAVRVIRRAAGKAPSELRVVAAPGEMWPEVSENALPSWPIPKDGRLALPLDRGRPWRLRLAGPGEGSWWVEVLPGQRAALLISTPARGIDLTVLDSDGRPAAGVNAMVQEAAARGGTLKTWASLYGNLGRLQAPGLPDEAEVSLMVFRRGAMPLVVRGRPSTLPREVRLRAGGELAGRLADERGAPLAGAVVEAEFFVASELPEVTVVKSRSGAKGEWRLAGLPAGKVAWTAAAPGYVPVSETVELEAGAQVNLGRRTMSAGVGLAVEVVDEAETPVAGARVEGGSRSLAATTDGTGLARLSGLPAAPLALRASAPGHLQAALHLNLPFPPKARIVLPRAFTLTGRLVDASGAPVLRGAARVDFRNCQREQALREGGRFSFELPPASEGGELILRSPATRELRVRVAPGSSGEERDLGDLTAPAGLAVSGRVVRADDGQPVPGARIWSTRQGPEGPAVAWASRDLLEATSGEDGGFLLSGLLPAHLSLRVEAAGLARRQIDLALGGEESGAGPDGTIDIGSIALGEGATLRVHVDRRGADREGAVARADLGNRWLEPDMLSAQVWNGEAVLPGVPAGKVTVSVVAGRRLVCERVTEVPEGGELDVDCRGPGLKVAGVVTVGGAPAGGGLLGWQMPDTDVPGRIDTVISPAGLRQQQLAGGGRPQVNVAVGADGRFETEELTAGHWRVLWFYQGSASSEVTVDIPEGDHFETVLGFPGFAVTGTVSDAVGKPVEGARVRELVSGALAMSGADGSFSLTGLKAGKAAVEARLRDQASQVAELELAAERPPAPLRLVLGDRKGQTVAVQVLGASGAPVAGAFVFLEEAGKGQRLLVADGAGKATATLEPPLPAQVRAAAFAGGSWAFGGWSSREAAEEGLALQVGNGGSSLTVTTSKRDGSPRIVGPEGWEVSWLLRQLGVPPALSPRRPLRVGGLAPGTYTVSLGGASVSVAVAADRAGEGVLE